MKWTKKFKIKSGVYNLDKFKYSKAVRLRYMIKKEDMLKMDREMKLKKILKSNI